jgi:uncharacterized protein
MDLGIIFLTGLTTGGISCLAMQGGLLTSVIANQKKIGLKDTSDLLPISMFLISKLITYTILGFLLGALGSIIALSLEVRLAFQIFTALFMLATAANLLNLHPIFRYVVFQPPKIVQRYIRKTSRMSTFFTPITLGAMTVFIPCGVTQAMAVLAINTGNPFYGAAIMFAFTLGTSPLFALIGLATAKLSDLWQKNFAYIASFVLVAMSLYYLNGVLFVLDSPLSVHNFSNRFDALAQQMARKTGTDPIPSNNDLHVIQNNGVQQVILEIKPAGYLPNEFTVKKDIPVELTLKSNGVYSCASAFTFRKFNIFTQLKPVDQETFTFTPNEKGSFRFSCSMGMYGGTMHVI